MLEKRKLKVFHIFHVDGSECVQLRRKSLMMSRCHSRFTSRAHDNRTKTLHNAAHHRVLRMRRFSVIFKTIYNSKKSSEEKGRRARETKEENSVAMSFF